MDVSHLNKKQIAMLGALFGDALGVPHEFKADHAIKADYIDHPNTIPVEYKSYGVPLGVYSDDFSQMLCVDENYSQHPDAPDLFYKDLLLWRNGKYWVSGQKFDEGMQTASQLMYYGRNGDIKIHEEQMSGNGSLMRVLPIAFMTDDIHTMKVWTFQCSAITHNSDECINACQFYNILARLVADQPEGCTPDQFSALWDTVIGVMAWDPTNVGADDLGSGYVMSTLNVVKDCIEHSTSFAGAIKRAIMYGEDTDTNASVVGGIAALVFGLADVPQEWWDFIQPSLENRYVHKLIHQGENHDATVH